MAETDKGLVSSEPRTMTISGSVGQPELDGGEVIVAFHKVSDTEMEAATMSLVKESEDFELGEEIDLVSAQIDTLMDVYTFSITLDSSGTKTYAFNAYNKDGGLTYSESQELTLSAGIAQEVRFSVPKTADIASFELLGSIIKFSSPSEIITAIATLGANLPKPDAVSLDLGMTGTSETLGPASGCEIVINFKGQARTPCALGAGLNCLP